MNERLKFIFKALDDAGIGLSLAAKIFDGAVSRNTLNKWRKGETPPRTEFVVKIIHNYAVLIRKAVDRDLLPLHKSVPMKSRLATTKNVLRAVKDIR